MIRCDGCGAVLDTDIHPEAYDDFMDMWWCYGCYPDYDSDEPFPVQAILNWIQGR